MNLPDLPVPIAKTFESYRNIATIKTSQDLFDDLVSDTSQLPVVQTWADEASGIDHGEDQKHRTFQYAKISTPPPELTTPTRFTDNTNFGVWYGALERETSIEEALYWNYRYVYRPMLARATKPIVADRRMLIADCEAQKTVDLRPLEKDFPNLVHDNDYSLCQALGAHAVATSIDAFLTPSARRKGGTCTPVFNAHVLKNARAFGYFHFEFLLDGTVRITTDHDEVRQIPDHW